MKKICILAVLVLALVLIFAACGETMQSPVSVQAKAETETAVPTAEVSTPAPETEEADDGVKFPAFVSVDLEGNEVTESIFAEKDLTVVNIWGTFCPPCIGEMPELGEWAREMPENMQIVGLIIDIYGDAAEENTALAIEISENANAEFTQIIANGDLDALVRSVYAVPTTIFVDRNGCIVGNAVVGANVERYKSFAEEFLNGQS